MYTKRFQIKLQCTIAYRADGMKDVFSTNLLIQSKANQRSQFDIHLSINWIMGEVDRLHASSENNQKYNDEMKNIEFIMSWRKLAFS